MSVTRVVDIDVNVYIEMVCAKYHREIDWGECLKIIYVDSCLYCIEDEKKEEKK